MSFQIKKKSGVVHAILNLNYEYLSRSAEIDPVARNITFLQAMYFVQK